MLRDTKEPYPIDLDVTFGGTKLTAKGTVQDPFEWTDPDVDLTLSGPNLVRDLSAARHPRPADAALQDQRQARARSRRVEVRARPNGTSATATSPATSSIDERKKPRVPDRQARLQQSRLQGPGAAGRRAAGQAGNVNQKQRQTQQQLEATRRSFPNVPLQVEKLRAMNMDVTLDAREGGGARLPAGAGAESSAC